MKWALGISLFYSCTVTKSENSGGPLNNQTRQTEWKIAPFPEAQMYECENQTLEGFASFSKLFIMTLEVWRHWNCQLYWKQVYSETWFSFSWSFSWDGEKLYCCNLNFSVIMLNFVFPHIYWFKRETLIATILQRNIMDYLGGCPFLGNSYIYIHIKIYKSCSKSTFTFTKVHSHFGFEILVTDRRFSAWKCFLSIFVANVC